MMIFEDNMRSILCYECSNILSKDEVGLNRKLIDEDVDEFLCIKCLSDYFGCTIHDLECKIEEFKEEGCKQFM